jgi:hypothetical protein
MAKEATFICGSKQISYELLAPALTWFRLTLLHERHRPRTRGNYGVWNKFIHQPQTARCLVFLTLLRMIYQYIIQDYEDAINEIRPFLELNVSQRGEVGHLLRLQGAHAFHRAVLIA